MEKGWLPSRPITPPATGCKALKPLPRVAAALVLQRCWRLEAAQGRAGSKNKGPGPGAQGALTWTARRERLGGRKHSAPLGPGRPRGRWAGAARADAPVGGARESGDASLQVPPAPGTQFVAPFPPPDAVWVREVAAGRGDGLSGRRSGLLLAWPRAAAALAPRAVVLR